jgi:branched-chain amino acid transport system ATP-binding protein
MGSGVARDLPSQIVRIEAMTILLAKGVSVRFDGLVALDDVNLDIQRGEIRGVIGPNGAGKTTLINLLTGINDPTDGEIFVDGASIKGLKASDVAALGVCRTFQTTQSFRGLTVLENVMAGDHRASAASVFASALSLPSMRRREELCRQRAWEALVFVGMERFADRDSAELSFGQQRMIEIARALVSNPKILLLDEPAVGLSLDRVYELEELLKRIRRERGTTILIVEHVIRLIMSLCDRITVLASGAKIAEGTADEVAKDEKVAEAYLGRRQHAVG